MGDLASVGERRLSFLRIFFNHSSPYTLALASPAIADLRLFPSIVDRFKYIALFNYHHEWTHARAREFTVLVQFCFSLLSLSRARSLFNAHEMRTIRFVELNVLQIHWHFSFHNIYTFNAAWHGCWVPLTQHTH